MTVETGDYVFVPGYGYGTVLLECETEDGTSFLVSYKDDDTVVCKQSEIVLVSRGLEFDMLGG